MTAWDELLACSSLSSGDAWTLITHPKTGGGGTVLMGTNYEYILTEDHITFEVTSTDELTLNVTDEVITTDIVDDTIKLTIQEEELMIIKEC